MYHVANLALSHGAEDDQGLRRDDVLSLLLLDGEVPYLGAVPMSNYDPVTLLSYLGYLLAGNGDVSHLFLESALLIGLLDGVATKQPDEKEKRFVLNTINIYVIISFSQP